ncbi:glutamine synthetase 1, mitochondrial-like [Pectinophora gossypiella]|uniref:glutamine synthetase 1, mitochondrial-like n=1 Tax=Pectinophora gossypiella TaxID=13191 RepID=UPI00214F2233|nr:glutamine synthetase 1, mitochondrial-like [Pectinophora gossypiella]
MSSGIRNEAPINAYYNHFLNLKLPADKVFATYVWIDGSGINMRSKDRILNKVPHNLSMIPKWSFDGSSTGQAKTENSDTLLIPAAMYRDPFRKSPNVIILCETYFDNGTPTDTNHRNHCAKVLSKISDKDPFFGIEQEYTMLDLDMWPLGWPKTRGFPSVGKNRFSYCGVGPYVVGREIAECHANACIYAGMDFEGTNAEVMKSAWEFQVGIAKGIKAADDIWLGRYLLTRIAEYFGATISFHPKPMGKYLPGTGCHHNFSIKKMRSEGGLEEVQRVCKILCEKHDTYIKNYGLGNGEENKLRLTGKHETAPYDSCRWAVADRGASIRIQRSTVINKKGFLEDRRPAGDCDPYRVCALLAETCL